MTAIQFDGIFVGVVNKERRATLALLLHINIADDKKYYLELGYGSLIEWLVKRHHFCDRAANQRVQAARLLRDVPQVQEKLERGDVNLSTLAKAQSVIRMQENLSGQKVSAAKKAEVVEKIENQSVLKAEQILISIFPVTASKVKQDRITVINESTQRLATNLPNEVIEDLERVKELLSHTLPGATMAEAIAHLAKNYLDRNDPLRKETGASLAQCEGPISKALRALVLKRDNGRCTYCNPTNGRVCGSRYQPEVDHIIPLALGGTNAPENLRALCKKHNLLMSEKILGKSHANHWRKKPPEPPLQDK